MTAAAYSDWPDFMRAVHRAIGQGPGAARKEGNLTVKGQVGAWDGVLPKVAGINAQEALGDAYRWMGEVRTQLNNEANAAGHLGDNAFECGYSAALREAMGILLSAAAATVGEQRDQFDAFDAANPKARHPTLRKTEGGAE